MRAFAKLQFKADQPIKLSIWQPRVTQIVHADGAIADAATFCFLAEARRVSG
jgi:hypothetical protein